MTAHALSALISSIFCFVLAIFILVNNPKRGLNRIYFFTDMLLGVWTFSSFIMWQVDNIHFAILVNKINYVFAVFQPVLFAHLFYEFLGYKKRKKLVYYSYVFSSILAVLSCTPYFISGIERAGPDFLFLPKPNIIFSIFVCYQYILCCVVYFEALQEYRGLKSSKKKNSLFYLMVGTAVGFIGFTLFMIIVYRVNTPLRHIAHDYFIIGYSGIIAYAIVKHQLMDIQVIIKKTLVFAGLFAASYAVISVTAYFGSILFENFIHNKWIAMIPSVFIIVLMLRPLEKFLVNATDKFLFQKKYDYRNLLKTFTREVLTLLDISDLVKRTVTKLTEIVKLNNASILLYDEENDMFVTAASEGDTPDEKCIVPNSEELWEFLLDKEQYILLSGTEADLSKIPDKVKKNIACLNAGMIIPLIHNNEVLGLLSLGTKKSDEDYDQDDIGILLPLASTVSIALTNARLVLRLSEAQVLDAQREKMAVLGTLSAGINHEICNPLGIIRGQCELFLLNYRDGIFKSKTSDELVEKCQIIFGKVIAQTDRATTITKKLSAFSKPSQGHIEDNVDVKNELEEVLAFIEHDLELDNITMIREIPEDLPYVRADHKQLQEILFNLIRNAAQAIKGAGQITVACWNNNQRVFIDIKDTGEGIDKERMEKIFDPFFTTKEPGKGTGLGLFIVKQVVERNQGTISADSVPGQGTAFHLSFNAAHKGEKVG
jgi:signal transduction histidine kinase